MKKTTLGVILLSVGLFSLTGCNEKGEFTARDASISKSGIIQQVSAAQYTSEDSDTTLIDMSNVESVQIQCQAANINVLSDNSIQQAEIELIKGKSGAMKVTLETSVKNNILKIRTNEKQRHLINTDPIPILTVRLPVNTYDSLDVKNSFGKITIDTELEIHKLNVTNEAGSIIVSNYQINGDTTLSTSVGPIDVSLRNLPESMFVDLNTSVGEIDTNLPLTSTTKSNFVSESLQGYIGTTHSNSPKLVISSEVGSISLSK